MSNAVPNGWELTTIGNVGKVVTGSTPSTQEPAYWGNEVPFVSPADFNNSVYVKNTQRSLTKLGASKGRLLPRDSVLVTCIGSLGGIVMSPSECVTNQQINAVVPSAENDSRYCFYNILFNIEELTKNAGTTTIPIINKSTFELISLLRPPLPEQQKIASILTAVDDVIESIQAQINKLKDLKTGMIQDLLTKGIGHTEFKDSPVGRIPKAWKVMDLGMVTIESAFGPRFSSDSYDVNGSIGCIRTTDFDEFWDINYSTAPMANLNYEEFESHILEDGDLLITRSGTCGVVGVFRKQEKPMVAAAFLIRFRLTQEVNPLFIRYAMMSQSIQENIQLLASGGVQKNLSGSNLKTLLLPIPELEEQSLIVSVIESVGNQISLFKQKEAQLASLKKALMQDLLTGKVRVKVN